MSRGARTSVLLIGHGSTAYASAAGCLAQHASALRKRKVFANVQHATLNGGPDPVDVFSKFGDAERILIQPCFMTDGYLSRMATTSRLGIHEKDPRIVVCPPTGLSRGIVSLTAKVAEEIREANAWPDNDWDILLVAHGSSKDPASRRGSEQITHNLVGHTSAADIATCFIEEAPFVHDVAKSLKRPTAVMGLFAAPGGHALDDVPEALNDLPVPVQYSGAIGEDARMADVIMAILEAKMTTELVDS